jgi:hypothetical protein
MPVPARHCQLSAQGWTGSEFIETPLGSAQPFPHLSPHVFLGGLGNEYSLRDDVVMLGVMRYTKPLFYHVDVAMPHRILHSLFH